ncbi:MAG TPA: Clp protease ClpP [Clostridia bacterium]|nr:Clp protease ClpP [Clostridia bacterium]
MSKNISATKTRYYSLYLDEAKKEASVHIFGDITSWEWFENDVSSYTLAKEIEGLDVDTIHVHINSYGGEVAEGLAIYNMLRQHKAKVITYCDGFACSIASVVFMAGDERIMNNASLLFIHNAWTMAAGNANDFRKTAEDLDKITSASIKAYMEHVNISEEELRDLLDNETWLTADEALEMGFATKIVTESIKNPSQSARMALFRRVTQPLKQISNEDEVEPAPEPESPKQEQEPEQKINNLLKFIAAICH